MVMDKTISDDHLIALNQIFQVDDRLSRALKIHLPVLTHFQNDVHRFGIGRLRLPRRCCFYRRGLLCRNRCLRGRCRQIRPSRQLRRPLEHLDLNHVPELVHGARVRGHHGINAQIQTRSKPAGIANDSVRYRHFPRQETQFLSAYRTFLRHVCLLTVLNQHFLKCLLALFHFRCKGRITARPRWNLKAMFYNTNIFSRRNIVFVCEAAIHPKFCITCTE